MANLAIKGHPTRGKEVIEILEMLGGKNNNHDCARFSNRIYFINEDGEIESCNSKRHLDYIQLSLEEFLEKYPYKVGDWVQHNGATSCGSVFEIEKIQWEGGNVKYIVKQLGCCGYGKKIKITAEHLKRYKETYKEGEEKSLLAALIEHFRTTPKDELEREWNEHNELDEIGPTVEEYIAFVESIKKQSKYPQTYGECCKLVSANPYIRLMYDLSNGQKYPYDIENLQHYENIRRLLICRTAYWKIAGEQMRLGKTWNPNWENCNEYKYCLYITENKVNKGIFHNDNQILAFPTEEMRDAFYENFKDLIEECKELL